MLAVAQAFQQQPAGRLLLAAAGDAPDLGQADADAVPEQFQFLRDAVCRDGIQALGACQVRLVDEGAQVRRGLAGPDRVRVGLGGVLKIT